MPRHESNSNPDAITRPIDREAQPGRVRGEPAGGQVCERPVLEFTDGLLDDRVLTVLGVDHTRVLLLRIKRR